MIKLGVIQMSMTKDRDRNVAKATQMVSQAVAQGDVQALNYFVAQKYVEALGKFAESNQQKTVFMPLDASSLMGSIGSINELWKTMKDK